MIKTPTTGDDLRKPRDINLIVVNEYDYTEKADSYIPWHDDKMDQSCRHDMDIVLTPVISISLGLSAVFAVMPNKESPVFFPTCARAGVRSRAKPDNALRAVWRFCFTTAMSS